MIRKRFWQLWTYVLDHCPVERQSPSIGKVFECFCEDVCQGFAAPIRSHYAFNRAQFPYPLCAKAAPYINFRWMLYGGLYHAR